LLEALGKRRTFLGLTVILHGEIGILETREGTEQILATGRERDFIGDVEA